MVSHLTHAMTASAAVIALCIANRMSPLVIQAVLLLAVFVRVYLKAAFPADLLQQESFTPTEGAPSGAVDQALRYHVTMRDGKLVNSGSAGGVFTLQGATASSPIEGPPSHQCHMDGDFVIFLTLTGRAPLNKSQVFKVYGSAAYEGEQVMVLVQMQMDPQPDGSVDVIAGVGPCVVAVKRPQGSDQVSFIMQRTAQSLSLTAFTPTSSQLSTATEPCAVKVESTVSTPMTINSPEDSVGDLVEFGIYSKSPAPEEINALVVDLKRRALLTNSLVAAMAERERATLAMMGDMIAKNPWGSDKVAVQCAAISDWTKPALALASDECRASVAEHCKMHPKAAACECWDQDSPTYKRASCVTYRELFGDKAAAPPPAARPMEIMPPPSIDSIPAFRPRKAATWLDFFLG